MHALEAGKDVYCEKPLTFSVADGREMIVAVRSHNRILQTGSHERSNPISQFICEAAKSGKIGKLTKIVTKVGYNNKVDQDQVGNRCQCPRRSTIEPGWALRRCSRIMMTAVCIAFVSTMTIQAARSPTSVRTRMTWRLGHGAGYRRPD